MKYSFDFDCTLGEPIIQKLASFLIAGGAELWIITTRCSDTDGRKPEFGRNSSVYSVAKRLGIPKDRIILTEGDFKWKKVKELNIDIHFDDVPEEVEYIIQNGGNAMLIWDDSCKVSINSEHFGTLA